MWYRDNYFYLVLGSLEQVAKIIYQNSRMCKNIEFCSTE